MEKLDRLIEREIMARIICSELNNFTDLRPVLITILDHLKTYTDFQAISIRLHDDGDYPYFTYDGFPESFIKHENSLCSKDKHGEIITEPNSSEPLLECMCGNIIKGRFDPSFPFFTENGSFWSNHTTALLASTSDEDRQTHTRNYCNSCGYESVGLFPIKTAGEIIGLLQFNDLRKNMFTEDLIYFLEMIGEQVGMAVKNSLIHSKLKEAYEEINTLQGLLPICAHCKNIRSDQGLWEKVEEYFSKHANQDFTHSICPECVKELYPDIDLSKSE